MHLSSLLLGGALATATAGQGRTAAAVHSKEEAVVPVYAGAAASYHTWAHKHWVWLHHGQSNQQNATDIVDGYLSRGIPVGGNTNDTYICAVCCTLLLTSPVFSGERNITV